LCSNCGEFGFQYCSVSVTSNICGVAAATATATAVVAVVVVVVVVVVVLVVLLVQKVEYLLWKWYNCNGSSWNVLLTYYKALHTDNYKEYLTKCQVLNFG
jgi:uncharacterized protein (DUF983 family)